MNGYPFSKLINSLKRLFKDTADQFGKRITIQKLKTFATENATKKIKENDGKVIEVASIRAFFWTFLCISMEKKIRLYQVL